MRAGFGKLVFVIRHDILSSNSVKIVGARFEKRIPVEYHLPELDKLPPPATPCPLAAPSPGAPPTPF